MPGLFSAVSGQFTKYVILGTFLPVVLFLSLFLVFAKPLVPESIPIFKLLADLSKEWLTLSITAGAVVISGLLYNLNNPIIQFYEGYPWEHSRIGEWMRRRKRARFDRITALLKAPWVLLNEAVSDEDRAELNNGSTAVVYELDRFFPQKEYILPTKLGNAIRAFEGYSVTQYSMDAITLWPRIIAVTPKDYLAGIDDAKTAFDFFLNSSFLASFTSFILLAAGLAFKRPFAEDTLLISWIVEIFALAFCSWWCYEKSIGRAISWGLVVRGTFDLYRWDLLKQLGYAQKPTTRAEERALWLRIVQQIYYGDPLGKDGKPSDALLVDYKDPTDKVCSVSSDIGDAKMRLIYGLRPKLFGDKLTLTCSITNLDLRPITNALLNVKPATGWGYVWNTAAVRTHGRSKAPTMVENMHFNLGDLQPQQELTFTCCLMRLIENEAHP